MNVPRLVFIFPELSLADLITGDPDYGKHPVREHARRCLRCGFEIGAMRNLVWETRP